MVSQHKRAVGVFLTQSEAEAALQALQQHNFPMNRLSIVTKSTSSPEGESTSPVGITVGTGNQADEGAGAGAATGGALGGLTGLLIGLGVIAIPGIGPILLGGAAATALATTLAGGAIGAAAGGLIGGLIGLGIPEEQARKYSDRVALGHYLVMVEGADAEIQQAEAILSRQGIQDWSVFDTPGVDLAGNDLGQRV